MGKVFFNGCLIQSSSPQLVLSAFLRQLPLEIISVSHLVRSALAIFFMGIIKFTPYHPISINNYSVFLSILAFLHLKNNTKMYFGNNAKDLKLRFNKTYNLKKDRRSIHSTFRDTQQGI